MKINSKNLFARYYKWMYGKLPNDLCSFFWGSLFAITLKLIYIPGRVFNPNGSSRFWAGLGVWAAYFLLVSLGESIYSSWLGVPHEKEMEFIMGLPWYTLFVIMPLISAVVISFFFAIVAGIIVLIIRIETSGIHVPSGKFIGSAKDWVGAIRGKYCTKITWL